MSDGPIPQSLMPEFVGFMEAHNHDELPDGAWFAMLEGAAEAFLNKHKIRGDRNDAAHQYLRDSNPPPEA